MPLRANYTRIRFRDRIYGSEILKKKRVSGSGRYELQYDKKTGYKGEQKQRSRLLVITCVKRYV